MIKNKEGVFVLISISLILISIVSYLYFGLNFSPEFTGSSRFTVSYLDNKAKEEVQNIFSESSVKSFDNKYEITTGFLDEDSYEVFVEGIRQSGATIESSESFGPSISKELARKSLIAIVVASLLIIIFISFAFRKVSRPVSSWKYGVIATVALTHDAVIPVGIFSAISGFTTAEADVLFVTAILAVLGYSINDTIVIFDRIRERIYTKENERFEDSVDKGVVRSIRRSILTSLSTLIPLIALFIFVPVTKWFALTLIIGVIFGTLSSLFFAPSLLILWNRYMPEKKKDESDLSDIEKAEKELFNRLKSS